MNILSVTLRRQVPEANMRRQYIVEVSRNLFGEHIVSWRWGRIGSFGQRREQICVDAEEAINVATQLVRKRQSRQYLRTSVEGAAAGAVIETLGGAPAHEERTLTVVVRRNRHHKASNKQLAFWPEENQCNTATNQQATPVAREQRPSGAPQCRAYIERQVRIEQLLQAPEMQRSTRWGEKLRVYRADDLVANVLSKGSLLAYQRELYIEKASGVPEGGWPTHERRARPRRQIPYGAR